MEGGENVLENGLANGRQRKDPTGAHGVGVKRKEKSGAVDGLADGDADAGGESADETEDDKAMRVSGHGVVNFDQAPVARGRSGASGRQPRAPCSKQPELLARQFRGTLHPVATKVMKENQRCRM
jgi:hypothetical protein